MEIADWRERIDAINAELLRLLNRRTECALESAKLKRERGLPVCDPARERQVIDAILAQNEGPLSNAQVEAVFRAVIAQTVLAEEGSEGGKEGR